MLGDTLKCRVLSLNVPIRVAPNFIRPDYNSFNVNVASDQAMPVALYTMLFSMSRSELAEKLAANVNILSGSIGSQAC